MLSQLLSIFSILARFCVNASEAPAAPPRDETIRAIGGAIIADTKPPPVNEIDLRRAFEEPVHGLNQGVATILCKGEQLALGSVISADGYVLTKASEIKTPLTVRFAGGKVVPATVVATAADFDVALLKANVTGLQPLTFSDGEDIAVGKWIACVGTSELPLAVGIVSVGRRVSPADAVLGVYIEDSDVDNGATPGAYVRDVLRGGAMDAGIRGGDIIIAIDDEAVAERADVSTILARHRPGDRVAVEVERKEKKVRLEVVLSKRQQPSTRSTRQNTMGGKLSAHRTGFPVIIQHDAVTIQPTDCGSPIVSLDGKVVGMNIARAGRTETYAIPSSAIIKLIEQLKKPEHRVAASQPVDSTGIGSSGDRVLNSMQPTTRPAQ